MRLRSWLTLCFSLAFLGGACVNHSALTTARAVPADSWQFTVGVSFVPQFDGGGDFNVLGLPLLDLAARFGVSDRVDVGVRFNTMGFLTLDTKIEFLDQHSDGGITMAIKPAVGIDLVQAIGSQNVIFQVDVPFMLDVHTQDTTVTGSVKFSSLFDTLGRHDHYLGFDLLGDIAVDRPHFRVGPFVSMMWRLNNERRLSRAKDVLGAYGFAFKYRDTYK